VNTQFSVRGPLLVPYYQGKAGRTITDDNVREFWEHHEEAGKERGCYVFGIRAGRGLTPGYVGKATKSFRQEIFTHHKLTRYQQFLADYAKGSPVMFFLTAPRRKGPLNKSHVAELEKFLIQVALAANPDLLNIQGTRAEEWGIKGVLRGGRGNASKSAQAFKKMMNL